jgi:hypothetical protein
MLTILVAAVAFAGGAYVGAKSAATVKADLTALKADVAAVLAAVKAKV